MRKARGRRETRSLIPSFASSSSTIRSTHVATEGENGPPLTAGSHPLKKSEVCPSPFLLSLLSSALTWSLPLS